MRKFLAILLCCLFCLAPTARAQEAPQSAFGFFFDTAITLSAYGADDETLNAALDICTEYEALLSKTVEGSDVWNINHAQGQPVEVNAHTAEILRLALDICAASGGAFDITIAPAVALWDFSENSEGQLPDAAALAEKAALADYTRLTLEQSTVTLPAGMQIDLGGIAKGYIADRLAEFLADKGIANVLINLGGNIVTRGGKPDGSAWNVGIQDPQDARGVSVAYLPLHNASVVTSGIYERGFDVEGVRYHHILDPKTGYPVQNELASVSILSKNSALGDALSTACLALGEEKARELLANYPDVEAVFIARDGALRATDGLENTLVLLE